MKIYSIQLRLLKAIILSSLLLGYCFGDAIAANPVKATISKKESIPPQQVITRFLKWYKVNLHKANSFPFLIKDSAGNFMVNKEACTGYLNFLNTSHYISQKYLAYWKVYFDDKANELKDHPLQSDVPEGFDFDFVLVTQEPETILSKIANLKFKTVSMNEKVALIEVRLPTDKTVHYEFEMYKTNGVWQIGYISTPNYD